MTASPLDPPGPEGVPSSGGPGLDPALAALARLLGRAVARRHLTGDRHAVRPPDRAATAPDGAARETSSDTSYNSNAKEAGCSPDSSI